MRPRPESEKSERNAWREAVQPPLMLGGFSLFAAALIGFMLNANALAKAEFTATYGR